MAKATALEMNETIGEGKLTKVTQEVSHPLFSVPGNAAINML